MDKVNVEKVLGSVTQIDSASPSVPLRSSARVSKKKLDSLTKLASPTPEKKDDKGEPQEEAEKLPVRKPIIWPMEDKNLFFEAVNEYGKDFAAIQRYFVAKNKNKNSDVKTKEQIRRFYYRTWAMISPKLHFPSHIQKQTQELYGLINYGELRKKMKVRTKKDALRLNELVIKGFTQLRGKNKIINIRTPRCPILRRICGVEEPQETETKLPSSVRVELLPADNETWSRVQALAQNPRVRIHVPLQYRLSNLISYLQRRWISRHDKYKIKVMEGYDGDLGLADTKELLVLTAKPNAAVHMAQVNLSHYYNSHTKICLSSYEERLGKKGACLEILNKLYAEFGTKMKKQKVDSGIEKETRKTDGDGKEEVTLEQPKIDKEDVDSSHVKEGVAISNQGTLTSSAVKEDSQHEEAEHRKEGPDTIAEEPDTANEELLAKVKEGWTVENSRTLTVGDVYLMVGIDYKLELNYQWRAVAATDPVPPLSSLLSRLVRLARLTRTRCPVQCPCGHQCSEPKRPRKDSLNEDGGLSGLGGLGGLGSGDAIFRRPAVQTNLRRVAIGASRLDAESFRAQMDKLTPKYCNRRGRGIAAKTVVVQRTLPILPKADNGTSVVTLKVIPQSSHLSGEFQPVKVVASSDVSAPLSVASSEVSAPLSVVPRVTEPPAEPECLTSAAGPPDLPSSPTPSISTILSEPCKSFPPPTNFAGGGEDEGAPTTDLREGWLSEVTECSLSSILSHLDTSIKAPTSDNFDSTPPDVETHFQYLMTEASIDFTAKFAALAAEVSAESSQ